MDDTDVERILALLGEPDPGRRAQAFAAAGVLAARAADPVLPGRLAPADHVADRGIPSVDWVDPTAWLAGAVDVSVIVDWWRLELALDPMLADGLRLVVDPGPDPRGDARVPTAALRVLTAAGAASVVVGVPWPPGGRRAPAWTWPLRLAAGPGWSARPSWPGSDRPPTYWDTLVVPVDAAGRWAVASLALLGSDEPDPTTEPVRATAVIRAGSPAAPPTLAELARTAQRHAAAVVAVVDPGVDRAAWLISVVDQLAHNRPLDLALRLAGPPPALVVGDPAALAAGRISAVLTAAASSRPPAPPDDSGRPRRGARMRQIAAQGSYLHEIDEATEAAGLLREERAARRGTADRTLAARLTAGTEPVLLVAPRAEHTLRVWIGAGPTTGAAFPDVPADRPDGGVDLTVAVMDLTLRPGEERISQLLPLVLPGVGDAEPVTFRVVTGDVGEPVALRVAVLHRHRFVQTGILRGVVGAPSPPEFTVEAVVRDEVDLDLGTPHDVSLVLNHTATGTALASVITDDGVATFAPSDLDGVQERIAEQLEWLVADPGGFAGGWEAPEFGPLLIRLARLGHALDDALFGPSGLVVPAWRERLRAAERISVLTARPSARVPIELVYDRPLADGFFAEVRPCPDGPQHLAAGRCPGTCPGDDRRELVCPFGFWGVRKTVERSVHAPGVVVSDRATLTVAPDVERHRLALGGVVAAASARADHNDVEAWSTATAGLADTVELAGTWRQLARLVDDRRTAGRVPDVLMLVTHVGSGRDGLVLEIGEGDPWPVLRSWDPLLVRAAPANPLVMVLGCGTAGISEEILAPPARLLAEGAPAVVSSLVTVLGRDIVPVAVQLLAELRAAAAAGGRGALLGEAMRATRRRCLQQGQAAALALVAFGDADWQLVPGEGGAAPC